MGVKRREFSILFEGRRLVGVVVFRIVKGRKKRLGFKVGSCENNEGFLITLIMEGFGLRNIEDVSK